MRTAEWKEVKIKSLYRRREATGRPDLPLLSVYRDLGVVRREGRDDNFNKPGEDLSRYRVVHRCDLVLNKMKTWQGSLGVSDYEGIVSPAYFVCEPVSEFEPRFVHHLLRSQPLVAEYARRSKGIRPAQWVLPWYEFRNVELRLPGKGVQRAIADYLDAETARIDALIEKKRRMVELLEERLSSQVFASITGHDRARADTKESNLGWVDRIPDHWGTPPVSANFDLILGKMLNPGAVERGDQFPYLRNVNVQWDRIDFTEVASMHFNAEERRRFSLKKGDLLVCEGGEVGRAAVWGQGLENCYFQKAIHRLRPKNGANARYLMYCLRAAADRGAFKVEGNTSTIVHLTGEQLRVHRFPWPAKDEQHEIVTKLDKASADHRRTVDVVTRQIDLLIEHRSALITAAVTGELPIPGIAA